MPDEPAEVVGQVCQPDLHPRSSRADSTHEQAEAVLLSGKHRLDRRAHLGAGSVCLALRGREPHPWSASEVDLGGEAVPLQMSFVAPRPVSCVGPDGARGVRLIEQGREPRPIVSSGIRDRKPTHEAIGSVDAQVVLIAKHRNGDLDTRLAPLRTRQVWPWLA